MKSPRRVRVQLSGKDEGKISELLGKGIQPVRVMRRALILQQLHRGLGAAQVAGNANVAAKTVRAIAYRYQDEELEEALSRKASSWGEAAFGQQPEAAHYCHGVRSCSARPDPLDGAADRPGDETAEVSTHSRAGNNSGFTGKPRATAVAGKKCGAWQTWMRNTSPAWKMCWRLRETLVRT